MQIELGDCIWKDVIFNIRYKNCLKQNWTMYSNEHEARINLFEYIRNGYNLNNQYNVINIIKSGAGAYYDRIR